MKKIGLAVYGFHVNDTQVKETSLANIRGQQFVNIIEEFAQQYKGIFDNDIKNENIFTVISTELDQRINENGQIVYNFISGRVKTGEYGIVSELVNTITGEQINRSDNDAEVMPFSFGFMYSGGNVNMGIAVFQTEGRYGMKTYFTKRFKTFLCDKYEGLNIDISTIAPIQYIRGVMKNGFLNKLRMLKFVAPRDTNARLGVNEGIDVKEERIFSNLTGFIERNRDLILNRIERGNDLREIINLEDFDYDELRMEFKIGKSVKTLNLTNLDRIVITIELNNENLNIVDGHPTHDSLINIIKENAYDYLKEREI